MRIAQLWAKSIGPFFVNGPSLRGLKIVAWCVGRASGVRVETNIASRASAGGGRARFNNNDAMLIYKHEPRQHIKLWCSHTSSPSISLSLSLAVSWLGGGGFSFQTSQLCCVWCRCLLAWLRGILIYISTCAPCKKCTCRLLNKEYAVCEKRSRHCQQTRNCWGNMRGNKSENFILFPPRVRRVDLLPFPPFFLLNIRAANWSCVVVSFLLLTHKEVSICQKWGDSEFFPRVDGIASFWDTTNIERKSCLNNQQQGKFRCFSLKSLFTFTD